jgi:hypothetical protein
MTKTKLFVILLVVLLIVSVVALPVSAKMGKPGWTCYHSRGSGKPVCLPVYCIPGTQFCTRSVRVK